MPPKTRKTKMKSQDFMNQLEKYRENIATKMAAIWAWLQEAMLFVIAPSRITWRDVWNQLLLRLCIVKSRIAVDSKEKKRLLEWVSMKIHQGKPPTDFNESWKDGITLCALVEGIVKGSCPRYDLLNPENAHSNLKLGLHLIEKNIRIKPGLTVEDFIHHDSITERKLVCLLSQLKLASAKLRLKSVIHRPAISLNPVTTIAAEGECIAKGMGLMLAVKGRKASFHLYLKSISIMNIVVEIRGPENTICSERITSRSPKKRRSPSKSQIGEEKVRKIPLEYNIQPGKITVGYTPLEIGTHRLSIIWQGQHIIGSPYTISVDDAARTVAADPKEIKRLIVPLKRADSLEDFANKENLRNRKVNSVIFGDVRKLGNVTRRRVLRHYLIVDGTEVVIENSGLETLAKAVKDLRIKSKCTNPEYDLSKLNNNCNKSIDYNKSVEKHLTHKDSKKKEMTLTKSNPDTVREIPKHFELINQKFRSCNEDKSDTLIADVIDGSSRYNTLDENECTNKEETVIFKQPNHKALTRETHLKQKEENITTLSKDQIFPFSNSLSSKLKRVSNEPISSQSLYEGKQDYHHSQHQSTKVDNGIISTLNVQQGVIISHKERENSPTSSQENEIVFTNQFSEFPVNSSCDSIYQNNLSTNTSCNERTKIQEYQNENSSVEFAYLQNTVLVTQKSSCYLDNIQSKDNTDTLIDKGSGSKFIADNISVKASDYIQPELIDITHSDNNETWDFSNLNSNISVEQNNEQESNTISEDSETYCCDYSLQKLQTVAKMITYNNENPQENNQDFISVPGMAEKINHVPENICSQNIGEIYYPNSDTLLTSVYLKEHDNEDKVCDEHNTKYFQGDKTTPEQPNRDIDITEVSRHEYNITRKLEQKQYPKEEMVSNNGYIIVLEGNQTSSESRAQSFVDNTTANLTEKINLPDLPETSTKEFSSKHAAIQILEQKEETNIMKNQEENKFDRNVHNINQSKNEIKHTVQSRKEKTFPDNEEMIQKKYDLKRKDFLLGLSDEEFEIVEPYTASPGICHLVFQDETARKTTSLSHSCSTNELYYNAKSKISMNVNKFPPSEYVKSGNDNLDTMEISINTKVSTEHEISLIDVKSLSQKPSEGKSTNLIFSCSNTGIKVANDELATYSKELNRAPEKPLHSLEPVFDKSNSPFFRPDFVNLSYNSSLQNSASSCSNFSCSANQTQTNANLNDAEFVINSDDSSDITCNINKQAVGSILSKQGNNCVTAKGLSETISFENSKELGITLDNKQLPISELHLKKSGEMNFKPLQEEFFCDLQNTISKSSSSISGEPISLVLQNKDRNTKPQSNEILECIKCYDDEEEEFPFSAIVQVKKEYWERKLEEKISKQVPKVLSDRKDCNNVGKLKRFWQHIANDSETSDKTKDYPHHYTNC